MPGEIAHAGRRQGAVTAALEAQDVTLVVLAGGEGRRMGGADKGLVNYRGRALVEHVLERMTPQVGAVVVSANRNADRYAAYGHPVVADVRPGFNGPLAGIEAALAMVRTPWALVVPCDLPRLPLDLLICLAGEASAAVACVNGRRHGVLLLPTEARSLIGTLLGQGERRLMALADVLSARQVDFADRPEAFDNLNSPDSLDR